MSRMPLHERLKIQGMDPANWHTHMPFFGGSCVMKGSFVEKSSLFHYVPIKRCWAHLQLCSFKEKPRMVFLARHQGSKLLEKE